MINGDAGSTAVFKTTTQADSHNSICFGGRRWGAYLRRKDLPLHLYIQAATLALFPTYFSRIRTISPFHKL